MATELRELIREVLDKLASDIEVMSASGLSLNRIDETFAKAENQIYS